MSGHVMISYQWDSQERAVYIRDKLREHGYKVWFDLDDMKGDIVDAMADAVQNSAVVLMCMSERYKESSNCRSEAQYAHKLKRPIIPLLMEEGLVIYEVFGPRRLYSCRSGSLLQIIIDVVCFISGWYYRSIICTQLEASYHPSAHGRRTCDL
ncbi:uncharacterized protein [Amphiura filiformis]|uniref:uncharacterized protein isoform X1 n=1 Tax=Amphiura filiformis TaxID=82378 RepID=UPI003B225BA5